MVAHRFFLGVRGLVAQSALEILLWIVFLALAGYVLLQQLGVSLFG